MIGSAFTDMLLYLNREKQLNLHVFAAVRNVNRAEKRFDGFWSSDELSFVPYRAGEEIKAEIRPDYIITVPETPIRRCMRSSRQKL